MTKAQTPGEAEADFQRQVIELGHMLGYKHLHVRKSIGGKSQGWKTTTNRKGWVDLLMWHPRGGVVVFELKVPGGYATPEQEEVVTELAGAGIPAAVVYPKDMELIRDMLLAARTRFTPTEPIGLRLDPPTESRTNA